MKKKRSVIKVLGLIAVILGCVVAIIWDLLRHFPKLDAPAREERLRQWALKLLRIMGIPLNQQGAPIRQKNCLRVANHVSWLDIVVLYACGPCRFIAKAEVERFPLVGRIAKNANTLFLNRSSIKDAIRMSQTISAALVKGDCVAFFPEGTTSYGTGLLPLHASLFEAAVGAQCPVQAVVLRFHTNHSTRACTEAAYVHTSMMSTLWRILRCADVQVQVTGLEPIEVSAQDERRKISARVQAQMESVLNQLNYNRSTMLAAARPLQQGDSAQEQNEEAIAQQIDLELQNLFFDDTKKLIASARVAIPLLHAPPPSSHSKVSPLVQVRQVFQALKGGAHMLGYSEFSNAAKACEQCLDVWINAKKAPSQALVAFITTSIDQLESWLNALALDQPNNMQAAHFEAAAQQTKGGQ